MHIDTLKSIALNTLDDMKAKDITVLDVRDKTSVTDWMVLATGTSNRHISAVAERVEQAAKEANARPYGSEGRASSDWVLIDMGDMVVHIMTEHARQFYDLERLWGEPNPSSEHASQV